MLTRPDKLPRADFAAYGSLPEAEVEGRRLALAQRVLEEHSPKDLLPFLFRHGHAADAVALMYPAVQAGDAERGGDPPADANGVEDPLGHSAVAGPSTSADADASNSDWHPVTDRSDLRYQPCVTSCRTCATSLLSMSESLVAVFTGKDAR